MANKKYLTFDDVKLKQPLSEVKRSENGNTTLIVPESLIDEILQFFAHENIDYEVIKEPVLYPQEKLDAGMKKYNDTDPGRFNYEKPVLLITQFDPDALREWSRQLYGENIDPSYQQYIDDSSEEADKYYRTQYEFRPD